MVSEGECKDIVIIGVGSWTKEVMFWARRSGYNPVIAISHNELEKVKEYGLPCFIGVGSGKYRKEIVEKLEKYDPEYVNLIDPVTIIHNDVKLGKGILIAPFASVYHDAEIGDFTVISPYVDVGHNAKIGSFCLLGPHVWAYLCEIGDGTEIGGGAIVLQGRKVGKNCVVGAGAVVTKDVPDNARVLGIPAVPK
jgi:sugar O-acyltransferase (sialic acid O-acetyltransferase NeuD family)